MTEPSSSAQGRRVLVAVVTGVIGERVQAWRDEHDPGQARRIPPHSTLAYWPPTVDGDGIGTLEAQVRHAFDLPVSVHCGAVHEFANTEHTFYVALTATEALDRARTRLFDGSHVSMGTLTPWPWHITCVRRAHGRDLTALRYAAATLDFNDTWTVDTVAYLELRGDRYEPVAQWKV